MEALSVSSGIRAKLGRKVPPVDEDEIAQCFANKCGVNLIDDREDNIAGARAAGMRGVVYAVHAEFEREMARIGLGALLRV